MSERGDFSRQSFLGPDSEEMLAGLRVAIVGLGGGGSHIAQQLAHVGVGELRLFDPDTIDDSNLNRLVTGTARDVKARRPKVDILKRTIKSVRPWAKVVATEAPWGESAELLRDVHAVFGCVDRFDGRRNLESACRRYLLPYFDIGMNVQRLPSGRYAVSGQMIMTRPGGPCLQCLGFLTDERLAREAEVYGDAGPVPQVVWTNGSLASLAVGAFIQSVTPWAHPHAEPYIWLDLEGNSQTVKASNIPALTLKGPCPHYSHDPRALGAVRFTMPPSP